MVQELLIAGYVDSMSAFIRIYIGPFCRRSVFIIISIIRRTDVVHTDRQQARRHDDVTASAMCNNCCQRVFVLHNATMATLLI